MIAILLSLILNIICYLWFYDLRCNYFYIFYYLINNQHTNAQFFFWKFVTSVYSTNILQSNILQS